ncbi:MAG: sulfite oxidase heme-binding subunit YedZ [Acidobacteriota bacterium]
MNRKALILLKTATWIACLSPFLWLLWCAATNTLGPDPTKTITFTTGTATLEILLISLAITPVRRLSPRLGWLIKFRRLLGLFAFFYASLHLLTWMGLYCGFQPDAMLGDVVKRRYVTAGMAAWVLMLPLAATSTNWAIRKMGGKKWARLHRLVYIAAVVGIIHYWWQVKPGVLKPLDETLILAALLIARPVQVWLQRRKASARAAASPAPVRG